jgi:tRNA-specific 2-thiouridylase
VDAEAFAEHLEYPRGRGHVPAFSGSAGGAACGDLVRIGLALDGDRVAEAGFEASGCGAAIAAGSAAVALLEGATLLEAARIGPADVAAELGGLSPGKLHAADLAADALHVALGAAVHAESSRAAPVVAGRTLVAMSGGVDSAVAALLVQQAGREAIAVTLELWRDPANDAEASCCSAHAVRLARSVAHRMGLPHLTIDLRAAFADGVVAPFLAEYAAGRTPNPCVRCNGNVRLDAMLAVAGRLGAEDLATGHYARVTPDGLLRGAADPAKDQAYMLAALGPASVARMRFPLGELTKPEVRELARAAGLPVADKRDSQDLCFLAGTGKRAFLARHGGVRERPGPIVDRAGRTLGRHRGQHEFTVGQRKGLGVHAEAPLYVLGKDGDTVVVGPHAELATTAVAVRDAVLHRPVAEIDAVRLRYRSGPLACDARIEDGALRLRLGEPVDGAAPGQVACLLRGDAVVGHGIIAG